jgi:hypothetical protein
MENNITASAWNIWFGEWVYLDKRILILLTLDPLISMNQSEIARYSTKRETNVLAI